MHFTFIVDLLGARGVDDAILKELQALIANNYGQLRPDPPGQEMVNGKSNNHGNYFCIFVFLLF